MFQTVSDDGICKLVQALRGTMRDPESPSAQLALIAASHEMLQSGGKLVIASKASVAMVEDQAAALRLTNAAQNMATALDELGTEYFKAHKACGTSDIYGALDQVHSLERELEEIKHTAAVRKLVPLPEETVRKAQSIWGQNLGRQ